VLLCAPSLFGLFSLDSKYWIRVANDRVRFALFLKLAQAFRFRTPCIISTMASSRRPQLGRPKIGVFDSGVGGLTVLRALVDRIPEADYLYFGDTARLPYGSKSAATVAHYAVGAVRYLQEQGAELLVIACNTATALALDEIKSAAGAEVIGVIEPGAEAAAAASRKRRVVVIGTDATISSHAYRRALEARKVAVREKACPLFVPLVEEGWVEHPVTEQVARIYLSEAFSDDESDADVLVLGCTHYPLIKPLLRRVAPEHIAIVDSAESTAQNVVRQLQVGTLPSTKSERRSPPGLRFFATDSAEKFRRMGTRFLGLPVEDVVHVDLKE
jgi:glutamate racemase